ncbi:ribosome biogenesis GTPase Der [Candidatus Omnitrophota bacterium]
MKPHKHNPPQIVIIGRPNVGKSTLFNRITGKRKAVVEKAESTTRDRLSESVNFSGSIFKLIDTGGMRFNRSEEMASLVEKQVMFAIKEANKILFVCDVKDGVLPLDQKICDLIRKFSKPVVLVVNKVDNKQLLQHCHEFYNLGLGEPVAVSSLHGSGIRDLMEVIVKEHPYPTEEDRGLKNTVRLAVVGKPNAGKSLFVNAILGEERVIVSPEPGTTRDSIDTYFEKDKKGFVVIDTAGIRSKKKIKDAVTYFSILRTEQSVKKSDVCVILIDGMAGIDKEDYKIIDIVQKKLKPFVLTVNKWDLCKKEDIKMKDYEAVIRKNLRFIYNAPILFVSSLTGQNILDTLDWAYELAQRSRTNFSTDRLNLILKRIIIKETRLYSIRPIKNSPPEFEIIAKNPDVINGQSRNQIVNRLRSELALEGVPIKLNFRKKVFK